MKVKYYKIGVELLDQETKQPIEHIEQESETDFERAFAIYESFEIEENCAKYFNVILSNDEEIELTSSGYKNKRTAENE